MPTPKLVRDKIPEIAAARGKHMNVTVAHPMERLAFLEWKLSEETEEVLNADSTEEVAWEIGDVLTVLYALADHYGLDWYEDVMMPMSNKADECGEFKAFLIWDGNEPA